MREMERIITRSTIAHLMDGNIKMDTSPDLRASQLRDLVAFLSNLRSGGEHCQDGTAPPLLAVSEAPPPPAQSAISARVFLTRVYTIPAGRLAAVEEWRTGLDVDTTPANLVVHGPVGTGKTGLVVALIRSVIEPRGILPELVPEL